MSKLSDRAKYIPSGRLAQIVDGELLGDGGIYRGRNKSSNARFQLGTTSREYTEWLCGLLEGEGLAVRTGATRHFFVLSKTYPFLTQWRKRWYPDEIKVIPQDLQLTPLMMRHWYLGDGSLRINGGDKYAIQIAAMCFTRSDLERLVEMMSEFGLKASIWKSKCIALDQKSTVRFFDIIGPCPIPYYAYKWPRADYVLKPRPFVGNRKVTIEEETNILERLANGETPMQISTTAGITDRAIRYIRNKARSAE